MWPFLFHSPSSSPSPSSIAFSFPLLTKTQPERERRRAETKTRSSLSPSLSPSPLSCFLVSIVHVACEQWRVPTLQRFHHLLVHHSRTVLSPPPPFPGLLFTVHIACEQYRASPLYWPNRVWPKPKCVGLVQPGNKKNPKKNSQILYFIKKN